MLRIGETIDRYRVEALIGQGGMAAVYRARHVQLDSEHAIKVLFITAPAVRERLKKEGRVQANLRHPNIVSVTDILELQGSPALVMEYIDGPALDTWLLENRPTVEEAVWLFRGILRAVTAAHDRGVVHRDLKPANVLLSPTHEGFVPKVTDFGLVKSLSDRNGGRSHTQTGMALGTPEYMSPEQIRDASVVDQRADMWALGCILYELVCHKRAFSGPDKMSTFNLIVSGTYDPPRKYVDDLPRNVSEAIRALLEVDPEKRLAHCQELYDLLYEDVAAPRLGRLVSGQKVTPLLVDKTMPPIEPDPRRSPSPTASATAAAPTGAPAAKRAYSPTGLRADPASPQAVLRDLAAELTVESTPAARPMSLALPVLLATIVGMAIVGIVVFALNGPGGSVGLEPDRPTLSETVVPAPDAGAVAVPAPVEPAPAAPAPVAPAAPRPRPESPRVEAPRPEPRPEPAAAPAPSGSGTVLTQGDARSVWLVADGKRYEVGQVRPGTYQVLADFGGPEPVGAGRVNVAAGSTVTLQCSEFLLQCRPL